MNAQPRSWPYPMRFKGRSGPRTFYISDINTEENTAPTSHQCAHQRIMVPRPAHGFEPPEDLRQQWNAPSAYPRLGVGRGGVPLANNIGYTTSTTPPLPQGRSAVACVLGRLCSGTKIAKSEVRLPCSGTRARCFAARRGVPEHKRARGARYCPCSRRKSSWLRALLLIPPIHAYLGRNH